jgi:MFS family permease
MDTASLGDPTSRPLRWRLCLMMFLQYFIQGSYLPIASVYVQDALGFTAAQVGYFGMALALGPILTPFFFGQLVDRHFATERVLSCCHLAGGAVLLPCSSRATSGW